jgi:PKD repeat protein
MQVTDPSGQTDVDTQIIYINSRAPVADFTSKILYSYKPNVVFLDATKSYDPDYTDD